MEQERIINIMAKVSSHSEWILSDTPGPDVMTINDPG